MTEESHREAMNEAIRAQRERANVPKSMLPPGDEPMTPEPVALEPEPEPVPEPEPKRGLLARLRGR